MPPKAAVVEEFDDDTEFDVPLAPPPARGPAPSIDPDQRHAMEEMMRSMGLGGAGAGSAASAGSSMLDPSFLAGPSGAGAARSAPTTTTSTSTSNSNSNNELTPEQRTWTTLYPVYLDAKRPYGKGCRRIAYEKSCLFPQSGMMLAAVRKLQLPAVHELTKTHPKDWANPGRVRVRLFNEDFQSLHPVVKTKKQLIERIAYMIQDIAGGPPPPLPDLRELRDEIVERRTVRAQKAYAPPARPPAAAAATTTATTTTTTTGKGASGSGPADSLAAAATAAAAKKDLSVSAPALDPIRTRLAKVRFPEALGTGGPQSRLPPHSRAAEFGVLNQNLMDVGAAAQMMGPNNPMAGMLGMLGDDDEEADEAEDAAAPQQPDPFKHWSQNLSRRQRKRKIRVGR